MLIIKSMSNRLRLITRSVISRIQLETNSDNEYRFIL